MSRTYYLFAKYLSVIFFLMALTSCRHPNPHSKQKTSTQNSPRLEYLVNLNAYPYRVTVRLYKPPVETRFFQFKNPSSKTKWQNLHVRYPNGEGRKLEFDHRGKIDIPGGHDWVEVSYELEIEKLTRNKKLTGDSIFITPGSPLFDNLKQVQLLFQLGDGEKVATPWTHSSLLDSEKRKHVYMTGTPKQLIREFIVWGNAIDITERVREKSSQTYRFALDKKLSSDFRTDIAETGVKLGDYLFDHFTSISPLLITVHQQNNVTGESSPSGIEVAIGPSSDKNRAFRLMAHELVHLWNGEQLSYPDGKLQWLKEGITEWIALQILHQTDVSNLDDLADYLTSFLTKEGPGIAAYKRGLAIGIYLDSLAVSQKNCSITLPWLKAMHEAFSADQTITETFAVSNLETMYDKPLPKNAENLFSNSPVSPGDLLDRAAQLFGLQIDNTTDISEIIDKLPLKRLLKPCRKPQ